MSLNFPAAYSAKLKNRVIEEDWLVKLFYNTEGAAEFIGLSGKSKIVSSVQYYGIISRFGTITKNIDLVQSKASTGDFTITCINKYATGKLSDELFGGTKDYLNRKVLIYSCLDNESDLAKCALFPNEFRLVDISCGVNEITLTFEERTPWDNIMIPNAKNDLSQWIPVVYGEYTPEASSSGSENFLDEYALHPAPIVNVNGTKILSHVYGSIASNANPHVFESSIDGFAPMQNADAASEVWNGSYIIKADLDMTRSFKFAPNAVNNDATPAFTNPANAFTTHDDRSVSNASYAVFADSISDADTSGALLYLQIPQIEGGKVTSLKLYVNYWAELDSVNGVGSKLEFFDYSYGTGVTEKHLIFSLTTATDTGDDSASTWAEFDWNTADRYQSNDSLPEKVQLSAMFTSVAGGDVGGQLRVYDVYIKATVANGVTSTDIVQTLSFARGLGNMYCGGDGLGKDYTDGGGATATLAHEIHRDMMDRFAGFDFDNDYMKNWAAMNSARAGWNARLWLLEPVLLKDILEQLQFEGGFIFSPYADGDGSGTAGGIYIYIKDTYSSGDVVYTLNENHYLDLQVQTTNIKDAMSKINYNSHRHPAKNIFRQSNVFTNANRSDWNYETEENISEIDLNYLVNCGDNTNDIYDTGSTDGDNLPSESICVLIDRINGEPKLMISSSIIDKSKTDLDVGDIIQINDSELNPFGKTWSNIYLMITETRRSVDQLDIVAREVYSS